MGRRRRKRKLAKLLGISYEDSLVDAGGQQFDRHRKENSQQDFSNDWFGKRNKFFTYIPFKPCHSGNVKVHEDKKNNLTFYAGGSSRGVKLLEGAIHIDLASVWKPVMTSNCGFTLKYARKYDFINLGWKDFSAGSLTKEEWKELTGFLKARGEASKGRPQKVLVACMGGHGRTGSCLSILAGLLDWTKDDPVEFIRSRYCKEVVESKEQIEQIKTFTGLDVEEKPAKQSFFTSSASSFLKQGERYAIPDDATCLNTICKHRGYAHSQMSGSCLIGKCTCDMFDPGTVAFKPPVEKIAPETRDFGRINDTGGFILCPEDMRSAKDPDPGKIQLRKSVKKKEKPKQQENKYSNSYQGIEDTILDPTLQDLPVTFSRHQFWWCTQCLCAVSKGRHCFHCGKAREHYQEEAALLLTGRR